MKFLVDEKIQSEARSVNFQDVGIHDNNKLTEIKIDVSPNGNNFLAFTFTDEKGRVLTKTEWQPTGPEDDVLMKKAQNQTKRIKHIMTKYLPEAETKIEYDTNEGWIKYASTVKAKLDPVIAGSLVRIKAIYGQKNYVTLPNYIPFIERMDVAETGLAIQSIDKLVKDTPDVETHVNDPFSSNTTGVVDPTITQALGTVAQPPIGNTLPF